MLTSNQHAQIQVQPVKSLPLHLEAGAQTFVPLKPRLHTHPHSRSHQLYVVSVVDKLCYFKDKSYKGACYCIY